ncbi:hypothetical protein ACKTEK_07450 [Tepidamorphus sp. 3E244]|uniref:hypothetical protein n=1 Tax=Tepidamorphus sp. 3E244 TaxID=3385498 RepID=UPI0038FC15D3
MEKEDRPVSDADRTVKEPVSARQGVSSGRVVTILVVSVILVVIAFALSGVLGS